MQLPETLERIVSKLHREGGDDAKAGVAVIFRVDRGKLMLLLVKRAVVPGDPWSGDMAFPGGKRTPPDEAIMETVARELMEETDIDIKMGRYLGMMDPVLSSVKRDMTVAPLVFLLDDVPEITINDELSSHQWTEFGKLRWRRGRSLVKDFDVPVFDIGEERVWGLTYRMLDRLLEMAEED